MEEYVGKICLFCGTEIKDDDEVEICPSCGVPHHKGCWNKNGGCTTVGCSYQNCQKYGEAVSEICCRNCGYKLESDQDFCPKCGTPKNEKTKRYCNMCGTELQKDQDYCPKCGNKVDKYTDETTAIAQVNQNIYIKKKSTKPIIIAVTSVIVVIAIIVGILLLPNAIVSVDDLCSQGNYIEAYEKADEESKLKIKAESIAAVQSAISADALKDPSSFKLREAYYKQDLSTEGSPNAQLVLYVIGTNSFGANVSDYWLYIWDTNSNDWSLFTTVNDLDQEDYNYFDDDDEKLEKVLKNAARLSIENTMNFGIELDKEAIDRINNMFENGVLDNVEAVGIND